MSSRRKHGRPSPVVYLHGICVERDGVAILKNVSWQVNAGEHWVLLGPNGAGKTTLLNVLTGYEWPTVGRVETLGGRYGEVDLRAHRQRLALVSDALGRMLDGELTTAELIMAGARANLRVFDEPARAEIARFSAATRIAAVTDLLHRPFAKLSTGERQRTLFARSLMARPQVVVMDEPCQGLDFPGRELMLSTMTNFITQRRAPSLILSTHHFEEIPAGITHVLLLAQGEIFAAGPVDQALTSARLSQLYGVAVRVSKTKGRFTGRILRHDEPA